MLVSHPFLDVLISIHPDRFSIFVYKNFTLYLFFLMLLLISLLLEKRRPIHLFLERYAFALSILLWIMKLFISHILSLFVVINPLWLITICINLICLNVPFLIHIILRILTKILFYHLIPLSLLELLKS